MSTTNQNPAVVFAKAEGLKANGWAILAAMLAPLSFEDAPNFLVTVESEAKAKLKTEKLPTAYNTSKCVALKALRLGVALLDPVTGQPKGKSAVEKECKEAQARLDAAELAAMEGDEVQAGELTLATAAEFKARVMALLLAARDSGFNPEELALDALASLPE